MLPRDALSAAMSSPRRSKRPPETSETAITVAPAGELVRGDAADVPEALDDAALLREGQPRRSHARS